MAFDWMEFLRPSWKKLLVFLILYLLVPSLFYLAQCQVGASNTSAVNIVRSPWGSYCHAPIADLLALPLILGLLFFMFAISFFTMPFSDYFAKALFVMFLMILHLISCSLTYFLARKPSTRAKKTK